MNIDLYNKWQETGILYWRWRHFNGWRFKSDKRRIKRGEPNTVFQKEEVDHQAQWSKASFEQLKHDLENELHSWTPQISPSSKILKQDESSVLKMKRRIYSKERRKGSRISNNTRQVIIRSRIELKQTIEFICHSFRISKSSYFSIMKNYKEREITREQQPSVETTSDSRNLEILKQIASEFIESKLPFTSTDVSNELAFKWGASIYLSAITKVLKKELNLSFK